MAYRESGKDDLDELVIKGKIKSNKTPPEETFDGLYLRSKKPQPVVDDYEPVTSQDLEDETDRITVNLNYCGEMVAGRGIAYLNRK